MRRPQPASSSGSHRQHVPVYAERLHAGVHGVGPVPGATPPEDLGEGGVDPQCRTLRPVGGHGLDDVGDRQDARFPQDVPVLQAVGASG